MKDRYDIDVGLSDHSGNIYSLLSSLSFGSRILEFHSVFDKQMFGPDSSSSLTMSETKQLVEGVRIIESILNNKVDKFNNSKYENIKKIFGKTLSVNKTLYPGDVITFELLESKKPHGFGVPAKNYKSIIGKKVNKKLYKWDFITEGDICE
jgi:N-acetylneuraminate synthase